MLNCVNHITRRLLAILIFWSATCWSYAESTRFPYDVPVKTSNATDPAYYSFSHEDIDRMLQLIETYRNFRPSNTFLDYGVTFFPEIDLSTNQLRLVAKACVIMPQEAVPLNIAGNYFPGESHGEGFFDANFLATFKKSPALANGIPQAYTFTVLMESQVQLLLSKPGVLGIKAYQVKVDYGAQVRNSSTSIFYNLNIANEIPAMDVGSGATFMLAWPCPPFWKTE